MKRCKILDKIFVFVFSLVPTIVCATEYIVCGDNKEIPASFASIVSTLFTFIKIVVPIIFVITGIIAFVKVLFTGKAEDSFNKAKDKLIHNIIAAILIFFVVSIINFVVSFVAGTGNNFSSCLNCLLDPNGCLKIDKVDEDYCAGMTNGDCNAPVTDVDYGSGDTGVPDVPSYTPGVFVNNPHALTGQDTTVGTNVIQKKDSASGWDYYLYVPNKVDNPSSLPLIVFLHGNGIECGHGYHKMANGWGFAPYIEKGIEFNAYILMPQKPYKGSWDKATVKRIIDTEVSANGLDSKRISIWGYSMGAEDVPDMVNTYTNFFSSAVILAKGSDDPITGFATVPTYAFYGSADNYSNRVTPAFIKKLQNAGYTAYIKEYAGAGHDGLMEYIVPDQDIGNGFTTIMDWVLSQRRSN